MTYLIFILLFIGDDTMQKGPIKEEHSRILADFSLAGIDLRGAELLRFHPGETILREGMPMKYLLFVVSGKAKVCSAAPNGKDLLLCYYVSEGIVGDVELMTGTYVSSTMISAITEFSCIGLPYAKYADALKGNLSFVNLMGRGLALKLLRSSKNGVITALHSGEERLCAYLLVTAQDSVFSETLTDTARSIGISYRHLLRMLSRLCSEGILSKEKCGYRLVDRAELDRRAQDAYTR
jgi:CRP-like cAMP-binding protein